MSLVGYDNSDDELEESPNDRAGVTDCVIPKEHAEAKSNFLKSLLSSLPPPKASFSISNNEPNKNSGEQSKVKDVADASPSNELSMNSEKKQKQSVKILIPNLSEFEDDDIPKKKQKLLQSSAGLMDMLPAPKNTTLGKAADKLVPYVLTKKQVKKPSVTSAAKKASKPTPEDKSSITALVDYDDKDSDDDDNETNNSSDFFALKRQDSIVVSNTSSQTLLNIAPVAPTSITNLNSSSTMAISDLPKIHILPKTLVGYCDDNNEEKLNSNSLMMKISKPTNTSDNCHDLIIENEENTTESDNVKHLPSNNEYSDAPLNFRPEWASTVSFSNSKPQQSCQQYNVLHPSQQRKVFASTPELQETSNTPEVAKEIDITDERFLRLQGKKHRGKEDIQIIDISADQQLPGTGNILMKNLTEEVGYQPSRKKGEMPTTQQRRKHQITYLAFQAKERELELKNQWSSNRMTRRQTQAKYGF